MKDCVFCQIAAGESPASVFYEDDIVPGLMTPSLGSRKRTKNDDYENSRI